MAARITLNGTPVVHDQHAATVTSLLAARAIDPAHVVVEINRAIVDRDKFDECILLDGDVVEILRFVGGG